MEGQNIAFPCRKSEGARKIEWFKVRDDLSLEVLEQERCDWCNIYLDISRAKREHSGFYVCIEASYFPPDSNIYSMLQQNGTIKSVINLHVLKPGEMFEALKLTRPMVQGRIDAIIVTLEREIHARMYDFWMLVRRSTQLRKYYDNALNETLTLKKKHEKNMDILTWTTRDLMWGAVINVSIYVIIIMGAYFPLM